MTVDPNVAQLSAQSQGLLSAQAGSSPVKSDLDVLRQQLAAQQITPQQYQDQLRQVQQRLDAMAKDSLSAQQAMGALADSLKDGSATQAISDSLNRGDYQKAGQQLSDLSKQLDQLSPDAGIAPGEPPGPGRSANAAVKPGHRAERRGHVFGPPERGRQHRVAIARCASQCREAGKPESGDPVAAWATNAECAATVGRQIRKPRARE